MLRWPGSTARGLPVEKFITGIVLALGTVLAGIGYVISGFAGGFVGLAIALAIVGMGAAVQHPLSSALVAGAYREGRRRPAQDYSGRYRENHDYEHRIRCGLGRLANQFDCVGCDRRRWRLAGLAGIKPGGIIRYFGRSENRSR